uniref:Metalloendopeptidase n=1 Tax=Myripristis murdjan TaxID=586833 RepID=A0A668AEH0_9TELE
LPVRHICTLSPAGRQKRGPVITDDDIAQSRRRNAVPCTSRGCTWSKGSNGNVVIPVFISNSYSWAERRVIIRSLLTFHRTTCIRFVWWRGQSDYIYFFPGSGCWSYLGRQGGLQLISLNRFGCVYLPIVQHEVLHALGFHHEHVRSDRDDYVRIIFRNIQEDKKRNFRRVNTNNLNTPYDYNSVMHYSTYAFSISPGELQTITARNSNVEFGQATEMSRKDIRRVNRLYQCSEFKIKTKLSEHLADITCNL